MVRSKRLLADARAWKTPSYPTLLDLCKQASKPQMQVKQAETVRKRVASKKLMPAPCIAPNHPGLAYDDRSHKQKHLWQTADLPRELAGPAPEV